MKDLKIGDEVFYACQNGWKYRTGTYKITKIGRIYYYLDEGYRTKKIEIKTNNERTEFGGYGHVYKNEQAFKEKKGKDDMIRWFNNNYGLAFLSYKEIKHIYELAHQRQYDIINKK